MKKLFVCALAASMFTACSQDETISQQSPMQISFDGAFVENATRALTSADPSISTDGNNNTIAISSFDVWGYMDEPSGSVFTRDEVIKDGTAWNYAGELQYWYPGHSYKFQAIAPSKSTTNITVDSENGAFNNITFINYNGSEDLLYAESEVLDADEMIASGDKVNFTFNHMLSKVRFELTNGFTNKNTTIEVSNIKMTAPKSATLNVENKVWSNYVEEKDFTLNFSADETMILDAQESEVCFQERLTIPTAKEREYIVTFDVVLKQGDKEAIKGPKTAKIAGVALEMGKAYEFKAELNASNLTDDIVSGDDEIAPIVFHVVKVENWNDVKNKDLITTVGGEIASNMTLVSDAKTTKTVSLAAGVTFDGANHTLSITEGTKDYLVKSTLRLLETKGNATIMNLDINGNKVKYTDDKGKNYGIRGIFMTGDGDVTIDNVTIKNVTYTLNDDGNKTLKVINSEFEGWTSFTSEEATFENVAFTKGEYGRVRPYKKVVLKNCSFGEGVVVDAKFKDDGGVIRHPSIEFINCTYNGQPLTKEIVEGTLCYSLDNDFSKVTY